MYKYIDYATELYIEWVVQISTVINCVLRFCHFLATSKQLRGTPKRPIMKPLGPC